MAWCGLSVSCVVGGWVFFRWEVNSMKRYTVDICYKDGYREHSVYYVGEENFDVAAAMSELKEQLAQNVTVASYSVQYFDE